MYNITKGNVVPMKAILVHDEERFPVGASTGLSVRIYGHYRCIDAENVAVDQEENGVLYFDVPATLNNGVYGVEVKGKVNGTPWRTATDCVVKITPSTERNDGSEAVPEGDTYDIVMRVQIYKQQSSDTAIEEHNSDEASHPYILGELERIEGEIPTLPEHIVTDANYVHTDNNYTTEEKTKLANTYTITQTDEAIEQAKEDVSWATEEYIIKAGIGVVDSPRGRVVYFSSTAVSYIRILPLPHSASTGISFKVIGTPTEDTDNFVRISARGSIIFRTSNRPTIFKAGVTYKVEYTYISHDNLSCVYLEAWSGGTTTVAYTGSYNDLSDKPTIPTVPTNVSAFTNDAGYITKTVNDLVNYYLKGEVYTKTEVANLIAAIQQFHYEIYASISAVTSPAGNVLYLIGPVGTGSDKYEEYVYDSTKQEPWVKIGDTSIDLSGYYTSQQTDAAITSALNAALANYTTTAALTLLLAGKQDVINDLAEIRSGASAGATAYQKPQGGIPKSDLAQGVQDSLDLADTALQEDMLYVKVNNNGHEYVDLGLPSGTLWAKCNVGANSETGYGNYYMYGKGARQYNSEDAIYEGTENPLDLSVDTARQVLGGSWRMPTQAQMQELVNSTTYEWVTINGVNGGKFTAANGNYVFFPAAGVWNLGSQDNVGDGGDYWCSSPDGSSLAYFLYFYGGGNGVSNNGREIGCSVRGVILPDTTQLKKDLDKKADKVPNAINGNFAGLDANGNLTDSGSKASDFATTQQLPTTMGASGSGHKGGLVPDTPSTAGTTKFLREDGTWEAPPAAPVTSVNGQTGAVVLSIPDVSTKEDVTAIVAPVNATDATLPITTLATEVGKYYRIDVAVDTLAVTLPAMNDLTTVRTVIIYLTAGTTPAVTIVTADNKDVYYQNGYEIEAGNTYEVNALFNGSAWIIASVEIVVTNNGE